jgi:hypothetical protein
MVGFGNLNKFTKAGIQGNTDRQNWYQNVLGNNEFLNDRIASYQPSGMFKRKASDMTRLLENRQATSGLRGNANSEFDIASNVNQLASEDLQQYLDNMSGFETNALNVAGDMAGLGQNSAQAVMQGQLAEDQLNEEKKQNGFWRNILQSTISSGLGALIGSPLGAVGGGLGDVAGQMVGNQFNDMGYATRGFVKGKKWKSDADYFGGNQYTNYLSNSNNGNNFDWEDERQRREKRFNYY